MLRNLFKDKFDKAKSTIKGNGNNIVIQNSAVSINNDLGMEIQKLVAQGMHKEAAGLFKILTNGIAAQHPLFPDWRYEVDIIDGCPVFKHISNSPDATSKYPLHGNIKFNLPDQLKGFNNMNQIFKYSYDKQVDIELDIEELEILIGNYKIKNFKKGESDDRMIAVFEAPKFNPPTPMKLFYIDDSFSIDYLEIGLAEIEEPYYILDNSKQKDAKVYIRFKMNPNNLYDSEFRIKVSSGYIDDVEANLWVTKFLSKAKKNIPFVLKLLKENIILFKATPDTLSCSLSYDVDQYTNIFEKLYKIQEFYNVKFKLPDAGISESELEIINILELAMLGKPRKGKYISITTHLKIDGCLFSNIKNISDKPMKKISFVFNNKEYELYGASIRFEEYTVDFYNPIIKDRENVLERISSMGKDDILEIELIPSNKKDKKKGLCLEHFIYKSE